IVSLRAEVIVDNVKNPHEAARVRLIDKRFEILRPAISAVWRIEQHTIVTPVAPSSKIRNRHQLDRGQAGLRHVIKPLDCAPESSDGRKGANVKLQSSSM